MSCKNNICILYIAMASLVTNEEPAMASVVTNDDTKEISYDAQPIIETINSKQIRFVELTKGERCDEESYSAFNYHVKYNSTNPKEPVKDLPFPPTKDQSTGLFEWILNNKGEANKINIAVCGLLGNVCVLDTVLQGMQMWEEVYSSENTDINVEFTFSLKGTYFSPVIAPGKEFPTSSDLGSGSSYETMAKARVSNERYFSNINFSDDITKLFKDGVLNILIIVDVQNCFMYHSDSVSTDLTMKANANGLQMGDIQNSVRVANEIAEIVQSMPEQSIVVFTRDYHPLNHISFEKEEGRVADFKSTWPIHCRNANATCKSRLTDEPHAPLAPRADFKTVGEVLPDLPDEGINEDIKNSFVKGTEISYLFYNTSLKNAVFNLNTNAAKGKNKIGSSHSLVENKNAKAEDNSLVENKNAKAEDIFGGKRRTRRNRKTTRKYHKKTCKCSSCIFGGKKNSSKKRKNKRTKRV